MLVDGRARGRCPLYNEGEEISAQNNDVDKWLDSGRRQGLGGHGWTGTCNIRTLSVTLEECNCSFLRKICRRLRKQDYRADS